MARRTRSADSSVHRAGISRRAFIAVCGGIGAVGVTALLWRLRVQPQRSYLIVPPEAIEPEPEAPFVHPPVPTEEPTVRVRVHRVRDEREVVLVGEEGQWLRLTQGQDAFVTATALRAPLRIRMGIMGWSVTDTLGFRSSVTGVEPIIVRPDGNAHDDVDEEHRERFNTSIFLGTRFFPGQLRFVARTSEDPVAFDIVNDVPLETYLPGVVSRELYNHWHYEAFAAQAIAARSFACAEHAYFLNRRHFDMTDTQTSQVYGGMTTHTTSLEAVADTRGQVLAYEGLLVPGYYSSCCGGIAAAAPDAIGPNPINAIAPLRGQSQQDICTALPVCSWRTQRPIDVTTQRIVAWARMRGDAELAELGELFTIEPTAHNEYGRPTRYALTDIYGTTVEMPAERLRTAINHSEPGLPTPARSLRSSHFTAAIEGDDFVFEGFGFGHGVGMCQHGAQLRARTGSTHQEILAWYYPDSKIVAAYP